MGENTASIQGNTWGGRGVCRRRCCFADVRCKMIRIKSFLSSLPVIRIRAGRGSLQEKIMIFTGKHEESSFLFNHRLLPDAAKDDDDDDECSGCCSRRRRCSREDDDDARFPDIFLDPTLFFLRRRRSDGAFRFFFKKNAAAAAIDHHRLSVIAASAAGAARHPVFLRVITLRTRLLKNHLPNPAHPQCFSCYCGKV